MSAIAEHTWAEHHTIQIGTHISISENVDTLHIKEALYIISEEKQKLLNKDQGIVIADYWAPLLRSMSSHR